MPPFGDDFHVLAVHVGAVAGDEDAAGRFEGGAGEDALSTTDAAENTARVVALEAVCGAALVSVFAAAFLDNGEAVADFHALDGVDAHQGFGDVGV